MLGVPVTNTYMSDLQPTKYDGSGFPIDGIYVSGPFTGSNSGNGLSQTASSSFAYNASTGLYVSYPASGGNVSTSPLVVGHAYRESIRDGGPSNALYNNRCKNIRSNWYPWSCWLIYLQWFSECS